MNSKAKIVKEMVDSIRSLEEHFQQIREKAKELVTEDDVNDS